LDHPGHFRALPGVGDADAPGPVVRPGSAYPDVAAGIDEVIVNAGGAQPIRCLLHRPALDQTGRVQHAAGIGVEIAVGGGAEFLAAVQDVTSVVGRGVDPQLATAQAGHLAVRLVGAEPRVDLAKPRECRLDV